MVENFKKRFRPLFQPALMEELESVGVYKKMDAGTTLMAYGDYVRSVPLLISGTIKILRADDAGNEILLYFLNPGETCAMTLVCCNGHKKSEIKAVAETDLELMLLPVQKIEEWSTKYKSWRNFSSETYYNQLMNAFKAVDIMAFSKLDERLLTYLKNKKEIAAQNQVKITHQEIANDLNSSRVVISRLLKKLEQEDRIELKHNYINLTNL